MSGLLRPLVQQGKTAHGMLVLWMAFGFFVEKETVENRQEQFADSLDFEDISAVASMP